MEYKLLHYIRDIKENGKRLSLKEQQQYVKRLKKNKRVSYVKHSNLNCKGLENT